MQHVRGNANILHILEAFRLILTSWSTASWWLDALACLLCLARQTRGCDKTLIKVHPTGTLTLNLHARSQHVLQPSYP